MGGIAYHQRVLYLAPTRSGKSELINRHFSALRCQRVLYDSKDEFAIPDVARVTDPDEIDWRQPIIHFVPGEDPVSDAEHVFRAAWRQPWPVVVAVHEAADLCEYRPNATPPPVKRWARQGGAHGKGLLSGSQRPVEMPTSLRTEADHVMLMVRTQLDPDDLAETARLFRMRPDELGQLVDETRAEHGEFAYLWLDKAEREIIVCPPLPAHLRRRSIVKRTANHH